MEVLQIQPPEPSMMFPYQGGMSRASSMYNSPKVLTCYGFESTSLPSRTPTPERRTQSCSPPSPPVPCQANSSSASSGSTLMEAVLMGRVPKAYSHMVTSTRCSTLPPSASSSSASLYSSMSSASSTVSSCHESMEEDAQTEPMDLSCKRTRLSSPPVPSPRQAPVAEHESSMLRRLLEQGREVPMASAPSSSSCYASRISNSPSPGVSAASPMGSRCDSPDSEKSSDSFISRPGFVVTGSTRVTLAKKNMYPVCSRVTDLLYKVVQFTKSIPEFMNLSHNDKVTLILNSWSKLLLLYMAEANFQFVVTPLFSEQSSEHDAAPSAGEPTMRGVENIQNFIRKCQHLNLDGKEYAFLKMLILFNSSYVGLERPDVVEQLNAVVQHLLRQHVDSRALEDYMHFSRVLLALPALYGTDSRMVENLFCKHIAKNTDMEVLLKEMLQAQ